MHAHLKVRVTVHAATRVACTYALLVLRTTPWYSQVCSMAAPYLVHTHTPTPSHNHGGNKCAISTHRPPAQHLSCIFAQHWPSAASLLTLLVNTCGLGSTVSLVATQEQHPFLQGVQQESLTREQVASSGSRMSGILGSASIPAGVPSSSSSIHTHLRFAACLPVVGCPFSVHFFSETPTCNGRCLLQFY